MSASAHGRTHAASGSPFEEEFGFSRAVRVGNRILVAGTGPVEDDGSTTNGDVTAQADRCFTIIKRSIEELGGSASDVVRVRMFLTDFADQSAVGAIQAKFFGKARPAATMVGVSWLCREEWKVEIEAEAIIESP